MLIIKKILWKFINKFHKEIKPKDHPILDGLTEYAINYFKDKVEPNKKFKTPNDKEKKALKNLVLKLKKLIKNQIQRKFKLLCIFCWKRKWL